MSEKILRNTPGKRFSKKIGVVVNFKMNVGGGAPRVVVDLVRALNELKYEVHFLSPWKLDFDKIEEIFEPLNIESEYYLDEKRVKYCKGRNLSRKMMKEGFIELANRVDLIIDIDGGLLHKYLPKDKKYIVWRISGIDPEKSEWEKNNFKGKFKNLIKKALGSDREDISDEHRVYTVDKWTKNSLIEKYNLNPFGILYPEIKTTEFDYGSEKKKDIVLVLGRISPNKRIDDAIRLFAGANTKNYKLFIVGGVTPDSENYIEYLKKIAKELGVGERITLVQEPNFELLKKIVEHSKILIECQRDISLTMTSIEALAGGAIVLSDKRGGTFQEVLGNGKYGFGFESIPEGSIKLEKIIRALEKEILNPEIFVRRAKFFSGDNFRERLKKILKENGF